MFGVARLSTQGLQSRYEFILHSTMNEQNYHINIDVKPKSPWLLS